VLAEANSNSMVAMIQRHWDSRRSSSPL